MSAPKVGTLDWQPARDRPDLLAPPVRTALADGELEAYAAAIDPDLADTAAFCAAYAVPLDVSANCVVVAGRRGETTTMAGCLILATNRVDVNKTVRLHLGVRKVSFAGMDDAVARTGMEYGGITPVGLPAGWPLLVDEAVARSPWIVVGSGLRASKLLVAGADAARLPSAAVLSLAAAG